MNRQKELAKNTIMILISKICTQFLSFLLLPLYTKILSTGEYGLVDLLTTFITLCVPIITLQLENSLFRFLIDERKNEDGKAKIISSSFKAIFLQIIFCLLIFVIVIQFVSIPYKLIIIFCVISTILSNICLQIARGLGDNKSYAIGSALSGMFTIILNVFFLMFLNMQASSMILSVALANLICFIYIFFKSKIYKYLKKIPKNDSTIRMMLKYSIPLIPNTLSWWIINVSDRLVIQYFLTTAANGIYAISNKFSGIFINIYNIFNISWTESASLHINDKDRDKFFSETIMTMFKLFACLDILIIAVIPFAFPFLVNSAYAESYNYIPILLLGTLCNIGVGLLSVVYVAKKLTKEITKTSFLAAIINIGVNVFLIKFIGVYAAAISTFAAFFIMMVYRYFGIKKLIDLKLDFKIIFYIFIALVIAIGFYYLNNIIGNIFSLILAILFSLKLNKNYLKIAINILRKKMKK